MYCISCNGYYEDGSTTCPTCGAAVIEGEIGFQKMPSLFFNNFMSAFFWSQAIIVGGMKSDLEVMLVLWIPICMIIAAIYASATRGKFIIIKSIHQFENQKKWLCLLYASIITGVGIYAICIKSATISIGIEVLFALFLTWLAYLKFPVGTVLLLLYNVISAVINVNASHILTLPLIQLLIAWYIHMSAYQHHRIMRLFNEDENAQVAVSKFP
jgi:hypothetical protein